CGSRPCHAPGPLVPRGVLLSRQKHNAPEPQPAGAAMIIPGPDEPDTPVTFVEATGAGCADAAMGMATSAATKQRAESVTNRFMSSLPMRGRNVRHSRSAPLEDH